MDTTTRTINALAFGALLVAMAAGCAKNTEDPGVATAVSAGPTSTAGASARPSLDPDAPVKYARCMREQGMTWFPDPQDGGKFAVRVPPDVSPEDMKKAEEACRQFSPNGGEKPRIDAEALENARQMSKCMRENGVPDFPDPNPDGGIEIKGDELGTGPGDPAFDKAHETCSKNMPDGGPRRVEGGPAEVGGA